MKGMVILFLNENIESSLCLSSAFVLPSFPRARYCGYCTVQYVDFALGQELFQGSGLHLRALVGVRSGLALLGVRPSRESRVCLVCPVLQ